MPATLSLCFIVITRPGAGRHDLAFEILNPDGARVARSPNVSAEIPDNGQMNRLGFTIAPLRLAHAGRHRFILYASGQPHFETTFEIGVGEAPQGEIVVQEPR
ncbi:MAG: hypothetical protein ACRD1S_07800 [Vicinamibacterales bacterium]